VNERNAHRSGRSHVRPFLGTAIAAWLSLWLTGRWCKASNMPEAAKSESSNGSTRTLVIGSVIIGLLGVGWFVMSHLVMGTTVPDAFGEALGVVLAVSVVASIAGAVISSARSNRNRQQR
jgi:hypothetical protein